jgi:putative membrane protein
MKMINISSVALIATISLGIASAEAASTKDFVHNAAIGSEFEIESSKLALEKSSNSDVKQFAQMMIDDHTKAADKLKDTLKSEGKDTAMADGVLDDKHQKMLDKLQSADADDFDGKYIAAQTSAHKEAISLFDDYAKNGDDKNVKNFAKKTLPTLEMHKKHVDELKAS